MATKVTKNMLNFSAFDKSADTTDNITEGSTNKFVNPTQEMTTITGATTAVAGTFYYATGTGPYGVTFPSSHTIGQKVYILTSRNLTDYITVVPYSGDKLDLSTDTGSSAYYRMAANEYLEVMSDGTDWSIVARRGRVTHRVTTTGTQSVDSTDPIEFATSRGSTNHGVWSSDTTFTAPRAGWYHVSASLMSSTDVDFNIKINTPDQTDAAIMGSSSSYNGSGYSSVVTAPVYMWAGETFTIGKNGDDFTSASSQTFNYLIVTEMGW